MNQVPTVAVLGSGGGFRAMVSLSGVFCALKDMGVLNCAMYAAGLSGSAWLVLLTCFVCTCSCQMSLDARIGGLEGEFRAE